MTLFGHPGKSKREIFEEWELQNEKRWKHKPSIFDSDWFVCGRCGKGYTFSRSFFTTRKGSAYFDVDQQKRVVAETDLCRECNTANRKFDFRLIESQCAAHEGMALEALRKSK